MKMKNKIVEKFINKLDKIKGVKGFDCPVCKGKLERKIQHRTYDIVSFNTCKSCQKFWVEVRDLDRELVAVQAYMNVEGSDNWNREKSENDWRNFNPVLWDYGVYRGYRDDEVIGIEDTGGWREVESWERVEEGEVEKRFWRKR